jgi:DNA-binding NarL/FixJ family response regulator
MYISVAPLTATNLQSCVPLWPDRAAYGGREFQEALDRCARLIDERRAIGALVLADGCVAAYGMSTFVDGKFADAYLAAPHPLLGRRVLQDTTVILGVDDIARGNAQHGLHLVILSASFDVTSPHAAEALGLSIQATTDAHRGYRLVRFINEAIGEKNIEFLASSAAFDLVQRFNAIDGTPPLPSALFVMTRERAAERKTPILPLFVYNHPRLLFTPAEQEVLRAALDGAPDEIVSERLGIPLSATKARWTRIHQRVAKRIPDLLRGASAPQNAARRGRQIRHVILKFVRENPSELTPYARRQRDSAA